MSSIRFSSVLVASLAMISLVHGATVLGTGSAALLGNDLTDPEGDGDPEADVNYNAVFLSAIDNGFGGSELAWNVFDNEVGPGNDKWCCGGGEPTNFPDNPIWVQATFDQPIILSHFTLTSGNDTPERDPVDWQIQGSNDGVNFTTIFAHTGSSVWTDRNQVIRWDGGGADFNTPEAFTTIRFETSATGLTSGPRFQLNEFEIFGTPIPEHSSIMLTFFLGGTLIICRRR